MSNQQWDDDDYDQQSGGELRKQYEKALKQLKAITTERDSLLAAKAQESASKSLVAKGYPPSVARFAAADGIDLTDEGALSKWLDDNKTVFAPTPNTQADDTNVSSTDAPVDDPEFRDEVESAFAAIQRVHSAGSSDMRNKYEATFGSLSADASPEEVLAAFNKAGL